MSYKGNLLVLPPRFRETGEFDEVLTNLFKSVNKCAIYGTPPTIILDKKDIPDTDESLVLYFDYLSYFTFSEIWESQNCLIGKCGSVNHFGFKGSETMSDLKTYISAARSKDDVCSILSLVSTYESDARFVVFDKDTKLIIRIGEWYSETQALKETVKPPVVYHNTYYPRAQQNQNVSYAKPTVSPKPEVIVVDGLEIIAIKPQFRRFASIPANFTLLINDISPHCKFKGVLKPSVCYVIGAICGTVFENEELALNKIYDLIREKKHGHLNLKALNPDLSIDSESSISISINITTETQP